MLEKKEDRKNNNLNNINKPQKKYRNIFSDGCYDIVHFGHANEMRQAKDICQLLKVGVHNDMDILINKGPTFFNFYERLTMIKAVKWVDEVIPNAPFVIDLKFVDNNDCDIVVHGDDITLSADGTDCYTDCKKNGRYIELRRTFDVSTTDIIERILNQTNFHMICHSETKGLLIGKCSFPKEKLALTFSHYICSIFESFISSWIDIYPSSDTMKLAFVPGVFDLFHPGMLNLLEKIKSQNFYVIVGVYDDQLSNQLKKGIRPVMNLYERALSLLACRYIDQLVICPDYPLNQDFIRSLNVEKVFCGSNSKHLYENINNLEVIEYDPVHRTSEIIDRIYRRKEDYLTRNYRKLNK